MSLLEMEIDQKKPLIKNQFIIDISAGKEKIRFFYCSNTVYLKQAPCSILLLNTNHLRFFWCALCIFFVAIFPFLFELLFFFILRETVMLAR